MSKTKAPPPEGYEESPEWTAEDTKRSVRGDEFFAQQLGADAAAKLLRPRGRPKSDNPKVEIKLRVDPDVLAAYRASGPGWQTRMQAALREHMPKRARS